MKILISNLTFTFLIILNLSFPKNDRFVVSILDFNGEDINPKLLKMCYQRLETSLIESNKFMVIEKGQRDEILKEQKFQASGICNDECVVEIGQLVGAEYLMLGEIIEFSGLYQIDIKIINVEKGNVEEKVTEEIFGGIKELLQAMEQSSRKIIAKITNQLQFEESINGSFIQKEKIYSNNPQLFNENSVSELVKPSTEPKVKYIPYDDPPKPISAIRPVYPETAQEAGIEGVVVVQAFIDKKGRVKETIIIKGIPNTGLDEAAKEAIRKTRFRPAKQKNKKVGVWISIPINFRLK